MSVEDKSLLRKEFLIKRRNLNETLKKSFDQCILNNILQSYEYKNSNVIFTYVSLNDEVNTLEFINKALEDSKTICVPKIISFKEGMRAVKISSIQELKPNNMKILEPENFDGTIEENKIDLAILPGVVFDKSGGRVGYGGGFYDRMAPLLKVSCKKIALAYSFCIIDSVPMENHDIKVDCIIDEKEVIIT